MDTPKTEPCTVENGCLTNATEIDKENVTRINRRHKIDVMKSQDFYWTAAFTNALLINGATFDDYDELIDEAIAIKERLIQRLS